MNTLPYLQLPRLMIIELMHFYVMWMNAFLVKSGVSKKWSLRELISRCKLDAKLHCETPLGAYCEVHMDLDITNTMEPRTEWGICLGPTRNMQGSYKFMPLSTGKKIVRRKSTEMPMTESVMQQLDKWAKKDRIQNGLTSLNRNGMEYKFNDNDNQATLVVHLRLRHSLIYLLKLQGYSWSMRKFMVQARSKTRPHKAMKNELCWWQRIGG